MAKPSARELFPGALELMVLQTLKREPMHGYALVQRIGTLSGGELRIEEGSLYPALQRMLRAGWLTATWERSDTNRRVRVYRVTAAGRSRADHEASSVDRLWKAIARVLAPADR